MQARGLWTAIRNTCIIVFSTKTITRANLPKVVIYGGGLNCGLFLGGLFCGYDKSPSRIIGIIDDENALNGLMVYGCKVLRSLTQIDEIYRKNKFDKDSIDIINEFCRNNGVEVTRVKLEETSLEN